MSVTPPVSTPPASTPRSGSAPLGDIAIVLGTRPEIIKLASVITALGERARVIHTGQHWDDTMAGRFFRDLGLGEPDVRLSGMTGVPRGQQIAAGIAELSAHFAADRPAVVIVQGDTNSTSAGAQAASYAGIPVIHVEAGLRSHDRSMPEELNRLVVGVLADLHCAATEQNRQNLLREAVDERSIVVTGNTVVEATRLALEATDDEEPLFHGDPQRKRVLVTIHRPENTDTRPALERVLRDLARTDAEIVFAAHPRTLAAITHYRLERYLADFDVRPGLGHSEFLALARQADLIVSDSGGVQEEVTVLAKPLLVVRQSTERPESIDAGFAALITPDDDLYGAIHSLLVAPGLEGELAALASPYGDGTAGDHIADLARETAADPTRWQVTANM